MNTRTWIISALVIMCATGGAATAQPVKLLPVDEMAADAGWTRFRASLIEALLKRDRKFIESVIDRNVRNISGTDGIAEFRKLWEPENTASPLWSELPKVLFLGSAQVKADKVSLFLLQLTVHSVNLAHTLAGGLHLSATEGARASP